MAFTVKIMRSIVLIVALTLAIALPHNSSPLASAQPDCVRSLVSATIEGSWDSHCMSRSLENAYALYYTFSILQQSNVTITLESETDPYLFLLSGSGMDAGHLAQNDDIDVWGKDFNSRIRAILDPGEYTVEATTYKRSVTGEFMLTVRGVGPLDDRAALGALYRATGGDDWYENANWLTDAPLNDWDGVHTDEYGRVVGLFLGGNDLVGRIPPEIGALSELTHLELSDNWLTGAIPPELGDLTKLQELELGSNFLTGTLPLKLGNLVNLVDLFLEENHLTGTIPSELGNLVALERLYLGDNRFWGELPLSLTALSKLERFEFDYNSAGLCAPVDAVFQEWLSAIAYVHGDRCVQPAAAPDEREMAALAAIYNATGGDDWFDRTNWLSDEPAQFWSGISVDSEGHISELRLGGNDLSGEIPTALSDLTSLNRLYLGGNDLAGTIPEKLGSLTGLERLHLDNNQLSGTIPSELGSLTNIKAIYLQGNQLTGALPSTFTQLTTLEVFAFSNGEAGLCAPTDDAFQSWLQGISNQDIAAGVVTLGPNCTDSTATPTPTPDPTVTITFGDLNWSSAMLQNRIAQYIAEKGYGYLTEVEFGATRSLFQALRTGDIDVLMEVWLPNQEESWEEALQEGVVSSPGSSLGTEWQSAFVIPKYLQAQYLDLDSVEDLKEEQYKTLFATDDTDGKARLVSCVIGWACEVVNAKQIEGYGLSEHVHIVNPGDGQSLNADITEAYENEEAWLGYQWGTNEPALLLDLVRLEEPAYSDECWTTTMACAYEDASILVAVNRGLSDSAGNFVDVLTRWDFSVEDAYRPVVRWLADNPDANTEAAALWWLRGNSESWSEWVTEDAAMSVRNALDNGEIPEGWPEEPSITPDLAPSGPCMETITGSTTINESWSSDCLSTRTAPRGTGDRYARLYTFTLGSRHLPGQVAVRRQWD